MFLSCHLFSLTDHIHVKISKNIYIIFFFFANSKLLGSNPKSVTMKFLNFWFNARS